MKKIAALVAAVLLGALAVVGPVPSAQADVFAYSYVQYVNKGTPRIINIKCHADAQWRGLAPGQNSKQVCAQNGWVSQIWVDSDVSLKIRPIGGTASNWGLGYHGYVPPGNWDVWVTAVAGV